MKLDEAAAILGVHPDTPIETLKQTYRRLALAWHPDKCSNPNAKEKFQQISIAYTKLISAQSIGGKRLEDEESDEDNASKKGDESHEMAAFMRMFMDLVGIFNEDQSLSEDGKIPAAGVSFGMMFGSRTGTAEEWSTEDEAEIDELEEEEEEVVDDEEFYDSDLEPDGTIWEPPAKQYSQMNLKEEVSKERQSKLTEETEQDAEIAEARRKLKNAKKRFERRRKQKDKRLREAALKEEEEEQLRQIEETKKREQEEATAKQEEDLRILRQAKIAQRVDLLQVIRTGDCAKVKSFIGDTLEPIKSSRASPLSAAVVQRASVMLELVNTQPLLHCCVSEPSSRLDGKDPGEGRLEVARFLLGLKNNMVNLNVTDDDGRTALHLAAKKEDSAILGVLLAAREESAERRAQLDINCRCGKSGWTILHYAAGQGDVTAVRLLMNAGAGLVVHATVGKAVTPLDLVKTRLQNAGHFSAAHIANLQQVAKEISEGVRALEKVKHQKEAERLLKEEKLEAARKKQAEREEKERELLERKQKQLKEKQDRDRNRDVEVKTVSGNTTQSSSLSGTSRSMSHNSSVAGGLTPQSLLSATSSPSPSFTPPSSSNTSVCNASIDHSEGLEGLKSAKKKKKKDKKSEAETLLTVNASDSGKVTVVDVASRDELLDHLLAMGFAEVDCFSAISLFGKDLDRALSWLCDRPAQTGESDSASSKSAVSSTHTHTTSSSTTVSSASDSATQLAEANRLQKEKDHKEELRRVNRAWNIKAEDEKKRAETEKRQKEDTRQSDLLQQQKQQQQLQQHLLQQQHLQQLIAQQQQQQLLHRPPNTSNYSFSNPIMSQGSSALNHNIHSNGTKMNSSANAPTNTNSLSSLSSLNTSSSSPHVAIDPQRDLRAREGLGPHSFSNSSPGTPMQILQSPNQRLDKQNLRIDRISSHNPQSGPQSPSTNAPSHTPSSSSNFAHSRSTLQNMTNVPYSTADHSGTLAPHNQQMNLSSGIRDDMVRGSGRGSGFRGQSGPPSPPSYDMSAYNELRAQALRMRGPQAMSHVSLGSNGSSAVSMAPPAASSFSKGPIGQLPSQVQAQIQAARGGSTRLGGGGGVGGERGSLSSQQYDTREYSALTGPPQLRPAPPSYSQNTSQHFLTPNPSPISNNQTQLRPQHMAFAPLGFDDTGRPRNSHTLPAGQSQQVFQSQQQLQEQESSRLHHQSQQYAFNDFSSEDDDFSDPSLELSVKAKPFIPQYMSPSSKSSTSPTAIPVLHSHHGMGSSSRSQGYLNMTGVNMGNSNGNSNGMNSASNGHTLSSSSLSLPGGMLDSWGSIGPSRSRNLSNTSLNSMGAGSISGLGSAPTGMEMQLNQAHLTSQSRGGQAQSQGQSQGQGQVFEKHLGSGGGSGFNLSVMSSLSGNLSPNLQMARPMPPSPQFSQYSGLGSHSSDRISPGGSSINSSYSSNPSNSRIRGIASLDFLGYEQDRQYPDGMPSLLSGLMTSNGSAAPGSASGGARDSYSISDRYSVSLDSDDNMRGLESRDQGLLSRLRQGKDQDPFGGGSLPQPGVRSFGGQGQGQGQGYDTDPSRGFNTNLNRG